MKKIILSAIAATGIATASFGQGVIYFDGSNNTSTSSTATSEGSVFINGKLDTGTDVNATLLGGSSAGSLTSIVTLLLSQNNATTTTALGTTQPAATDITFEGNGTILDAVSGNSYVIPTVAVGGTAYFEVEAWLGNYSSYAAAVAANAANGITTVFTEVLTSTTGTANDIENMSALNITSTPEPTTMALAGLGGLSLLFLRRKK